MSVYIDTTASAVDHLDAMSAFHPDLSSTYSTFRSLVTQKLYHQLTVQTLSFVSDISNLRSTAEGTNSFLALYDQVILTLEKRLNPLSLARIASAVSLSLIHPLTTATTAHDCTAAKAILENLLDKRDSLLGPIASIYVESKLHLIGLLQMEATGLVDTLALETTKEMLSRNQKSLIQLTSRRMGNHVGALLEGQSGLVGEGDDSGFTGSHRNSSSSNSSSHFSAATDSDWSMVHSAFYECSMMYRKCVGPPDVYYREAIQFLHYTPLTSLSRERKYQLATDLCLAALIADGVYNFGEIVHMYESKNRLEVDAKDPNVSTSFSLLECLEKTPNEWLLHLIRAAASGNVQHFYQVSQLYAKEIEAQSTLVSRASAIQEKVTLLALVHVIFEKPPQERTLSFQEIALAIQMPEHQVEWVLMRAMSLGLLKGVMDQVDGTVMVSWVMPQILNPTQLIGLKDRFSDWVVKVGTIRDFMEEHVPVTFG